MVSRRVGEYVYIRTLRLAENNTTGHCAYGDGVPSAWNPGNLERPCNGVLLIHYTTCLEGLVCTQNDSFPENSHFSLGASQDVFCPCCGAWHVFRVVRR